MLWLPPILLLAALCLSDLLRQLGRPATGLPGLLLGLVFAAGTLGLAVLLAEALDLGAAERALAWARNGIAAQPALVTIALAGAGLALALGGASRVVDRVTMVDPDGPLPSATAPAMACGLGLVLLLVSYTRL